MDLQELENEKVEKLRIHFVEMYKEFNSVYGDSFDTFMIREWAKLDASVLTASHNTREQMRVLIQRLESNSKANYNLLLNLEVAASMSPEKCKEYVAKLAKEKMDYDFVDDITNLIIMIEESIIESTSDIRLRLKDIKERFNGR